MLARVIRLHEGLAGATEEPLAVDQHQTTVAGARFPLPSWGPALLRRAFAEDDILLLCILAPPEKQFDEAEPFSEPQCVVSATLTGLLLVLRGNAVGNVRLAEHGKALTLYKLGSVLSDRPIPELNCKVTALSLSFAKDEPAVELTVCYAKHSVIPFSRKELRNIVSES